MTTLTSTEAKKIIAELEALKGDLEKLEPSEKQNEALLKLKAAIDALRESGK